MYATDAGGIRRPLAVRRMGQVAALGSSLSGHGDGLPRRCQLDGWIGHEPMRRSGRLGRPVRRPVPWEVRCRREVG